MSTTGYETTDNTENDAVDSASKDAAAPAIKRPPAGVSRVRRVHWQWNRKLAWISLCVCVAVGVAATASYYYHSTTTSHTFRMRAEAAASANDYAAHEKWLHRYSLLEPNDLDAVVDAALAADQAADRAPPERVAAAVNHARRQLSRAMGRLGAQSHERTNELRVRLIERLLQLGGPWFRDAEYEVISLQLPANDPRGTRWLALALIGQVRADIYQNRPPDKYDKQTEYWRWLANQKVGKVLASAVEQNQKDVELVASFLDAYEKLPDLFQLPDTLDENATQAWEAQLKRTTEQAIATVRSNGDSRSTLILYQFEKSRNQGSTESEALIDAAKTAAERLDGLDPSAEAELQGTDLPDYYWDYMLVLEAAQIMSGQKPKLASAWYEQLTSLDLKAIPKVTKEVVFALAGMLEFQEGRLEDAIEIWEAGLQQVNPDSLELLASVAKARVQNDDPQASDAIDDLQQALQLASLRLLKTPEREMSREARNEVGRRIDLAKWRMKVMRGIQAIRANNEIEAIKLLTAAAETTTGVALEEYVQVATLLASLHRSQGSWDQAAVVLDRALYLAPEDAKLRVQAAEAWMRSGNRERAAENWKAAGRSESLTTRVASLEASFEQQIQQLPEHRDFSGLRSSIQQIRDLWGSSIKGTSMESRLAILEAMVPPAGVLAEQHLQSPALGDDLVRIAEQYPDNQTVQTFTAVRLSQFGRKEAEQSIERLEAILGSDSPTLLIVKARAQVSTDGHLAACDQLIQQAKSDPENAKELLWVAADIATRANDPELVYRALINIPETGRSLGTLFDLARIANRLPADSKFLSPDGEQLSTAQLSQQWEKRLRELEGDQGSYWRYLKVKRIISQLQSEERSETSQLREAKELVRDILVQRPRWGAAISLQGWLSAIEGESERAVELLRRGIAAGDQDLQTRQKLWEQLIRLDREDEAEKEMRRASLASQSATFDNSASLRIGLASIDLALRRGHYMRGLKVAEKSVSERPNDVLGHVVLCRAATLAAGQATTVEERNDLIRRATTAIEKATDLAGTDRPEIYSARMGLLLLGNDQQQVLDEIERIQASQLDIFNKYTLESRARIALGDYETAEAVLKRAGELKQSFQVQLALADLSRRKGDLNGEIAALKLAMSLSPENPNVRNLLAHAMVSRDGENVDWGQISELLSVASAASNRFQHAILLINRGTEHQRTEGLDILREVVRERNKFSDDAGRFLAIVLIQRMQRLDEHQDSLRDRWLDEVRAIYESLTERASVKATDLFAYAGFILEHGDQKDLPIVKRILARLRSMRDGALYALDVSIRHARKIGQGDSIPDIVQSWADEVTRAELMKEPVAAQIAGVTLIKLGFGDEGLGWLEQSYRLDHKLLDAYAVALASLGQMKKGISICSKHFQEHRDAQSARLLAEILARNARGSTTPQSEEILQQAVELYGQDPNLLESVATLRLQQERYEEAIELYDSARQLEPFRIKTLNNLAMALSETPRAVEGIEAIDMAINIAGEHPELLDTKGVVLLKAGRLADAEAVFLKALRRVDEPRYRFHLVMSLLGQDKEAEAKRAWRSLDVGKLRLGAAAMTASELATLDLMTKKFGA